ncbi:hypothetical protein ACJMK2_026424 [Sinanodonta woodiana]|uniref:Peptidase S1 domain-containing protein n=1 Tax=Sinanodonta woodiana TaxID=1069815 RepID=A0ABD3XN10_SINWO
MAIALLSTIYLLLNVYHTEAATYCASVLHGQCVSLYGSGCPSGTLQTLSYCGFLETCCYGGSTGSTGTGSTGSTGTGSCGHPLVTGNHRIVGGVLSTPGAYPWQVSVRYGGEHLCGGTLIDQNWIVTAAHCFEGMSGDYWTVALGVHDMSQMYTANIHRTSVISVHGSYDSQTNENDIAMMKLDRPVDLSGMHIRPACLPSESADFTNRVCTVTGWGATHTGGSSTRYMLEVDVPIISNDMCEYYLGRGTVHYSNICAGYTQGGKDACQGDSGGPLVCKVGDSWALAGIVSWGYGCGQRNAPGVYTRVASFISWINYVKSRHP